MIRAFPLFLAIAMLTSGCACGHAPSGPNSGTSSGPVTAGTGKAYPLPGDIAPELRFAPKAKLTIGTDTFVMVDVDQRKQGSDLIVELQAHGQTFEKEVYRSDPNAFYLVDAVGAEYDPPIPLLQFPFKVGDSYKWSGKLVDGGQPSKATAEVVTSQDRLFLGVAGSTTDTILVEVRLQIDNGTPQPAQRKLSFWFAPGKGLVRRNFGSSTREPAN